MRRFPPLLLAFAALATACSDSTTEGESRDGLDAAAGVDAGADADAEAGIAASVTWSEHVAPLVAEHCGACHVDGGSAPFALDTHEALSTFGEAALDAMETGRMPPWSPATDCNPIADARVMPPEDIARFAEWVDQGMAAGPEREAPASPTFDFEPTHRAGLPEPYTPSTEEADDYRCFLLDLEFPEPKYLTATTVLPGNGLVHHVLVYGLQGQQIAEARQRDAADEGPGYTCFGGPVNFGIRRSVASLEDIAATLENVDFPTQLSAWVPGHSPTVYDEGMAMRIEADTVLVMQIHYSAVAGDPIADTATEFQAVLTDDEPEWLSTTTPLAQQGIEIPAGEVEVVETLSLPYYGDEPLRLVGMTGHMHLLGTAIRGDVVRADGSEQCGLHIPEWDFGWQESYRFEPDATLLVNDGDALRVTCTYDNSAANQPVVNGEQIAPRDVEWGDGTLDEMCLLYLRSVRPFTPPESPDAPACSPACADECGADTACLAECSGSDLGCFGCALGASIDCGSEACVGQLIAARRCLGRCGSAAVMLGGNFGRCMAAECGDDFTAAAGCVDAYLGAESCTDPREACGL